MADKNIRVSVRDLVEFILRSGDIDHNYVSSKRMQEGIRIHQRLQKKRERLSLLEGFEYKKEVGLSITLEAGGLELTVEGRADGISRAGGSVTVEEIKSTIASLDIPDPDENHVHLAQAKCYAHILCEKEELEMVNVLLIYCHAETGNTKEFLKTYSRDGLNDFFTGLTEKYCVWAKNDYDRRLDRDASIKGAPFVFDGYRKGQREFSVAAYRAIENGDNLFAQAPTGTGKTVSVIFPSVKALAEGFADKIFYLTAKTVTRQVAEETVELMNKKGYRLVSVTFTAKDKICVSEDKICSPESCACAKGHFDRVNGAVADIIKNERIIRRAVIQEYARKHTVCPHELALDVSAWCDIIICDYNHAFDPKVRLKRYFGETPPEKYILLVDEAHNLAERARDMFSAELCKRNFMEVRRYLKSTDAGLYQLCGKINDFFPKFFQAEAEEGQIVVKRELPDELTSMLFELAERADRFLARNSAERGEGFEKLLELYFSVLDYLSVGELFSDRYRFFAQDGKSPLFKLLCLDPSKLLREAHGKAVSSVFFSATLTPAQYFRQVLGGLEYDPAFRLPSPFPRENLCLIIEEGVSTRYKDRSGSFAEVADGIFSMTFGRKGNYIAFFPSYAYLNEVLTVFREKYPKTELLVQEQGLSDSGKEDFLANFREQDKKTLIAFCVMGGVFSEGVDLTGDRLIGVAVVGVGLPLISAERSLISEYYNESFEDNMGFDYAYVYPGINKVMQAAGRLIRSETDRGIVLLIDDRYRTEKYRALFPKEWENAVYLSGAEKIRSTVENFWRRT